MIQINRIEVVNYNGVGKPPYCEMVFKAVSDVSTPPDLTATIIFGDGKKPTNTFTISRVAEIPPGQSLLNFNCACHCLLLL